MNDRFSHYVERAKSDLMMDVVAKDLGMYAGETSNGCFWLSLAGALASSCWAVTSRHRAALPSFEDAWRSAGTASSLDVRYSALGRFAVELRKHMCSGDDAVMLKPHIQDSVYQAFAALGSSHTARTLESYKHWVARIAINEFADELVVLATAMELSVRIVVIPYTPAGQFPWHISRYPPEAIDVISNATIYLGNDDVHYSLPGK